MKKVTEFIPEVGDKVFFTNCSGHIVSIANNDGRPKWIYVKLTDFTGSPPAYEYQCPEVSTLKWNTNGLYWAVA